jgi:hypothetical protein
MTEVTSSLADVLAKKGLENNSSTFLTNYALAESVAIKMAQRAYEDIIIPVLKSNTHTQGSHVFFDKDEYWQLYSLNCGSNTINQILGDDKEYVDLALKVYNRCV